VIAQPVTHQLKALRAEVVRDNRIIKALRAQVVPPITTPAEAWTKITSLAALFSTTATANCGENYMVMPRLLFVPGIQVMSEYTFLQSDITGSPWCP